MTMAGKAVPSRAGAQLRSAASAVGSRQGQRVTTPGPGVGRPAAAVTDATAKVAAYRGANEAPTTPVTVGLNPNPPAVKLVSQPDALTSATPAAASAFQPFGGCY